MQETIYEHIGGEPTFTVTAAERWSVGMIQRLAKDFPDEVKITAENPDGSIVAHVPQSWMKIRPKRKRNMTEEQRKECAERLARARGE